MAEPLNAFAVTDDPDLEQFIKGNFDEPQERICREGVPDYRPEPRRPRVVSAIVESSKPKIFARARIQKKVDRFKYTPITGDQIRLLCIRKGTMDETLSCELLVTSLAKVKGRYEALSYCWGTEQPTEVIYIRKLSPKYYEDGTSNQSILSHGELEQFPVRPNLRNALRHLRSQETYTNIWVDAICIDQRDTEEARREKDWQLSMMNEIYNSAKNVCIWLGDADAKSESALRLVRDIMNFRQFDSHIETKDIEAKRKWCDLIDALKAPWFSRRWIIQEVAFARCASVHFGDDIIHWDDLADAVSLLNEKAELLRSQFDDQTFTEVHNLSATNLVKTIVNVCRKSDDGQILAKLWDLETLVSTLQQFQATFPEDIIYSVRSLAKDAPHPDEDRAFRTTVEHSKSTRDLFIAFVNRCIRNSHCLDIICRHWAPPVKDTADDDIKLPSWVSELSKSPFGLPGESGERQNGENFVAMSPNDNRKRYNAALGREALLHYPASSSIYTKGHNLDPQPPTIAISLPHSSGEIHENTPITDGEWTQSPPATPTLARRNSFSQPLKGIPEETSVRPDSVSTAVPQASLKIPLPALVTNRPLDPTLDKPQNLTKQTLHDTIEESTAIPQVSSSREAHIESATPSKANISAMLSPISTSNTASAQVQRGLSPQTASPTAPFPRRNSRRDSKQPQRRYTQEDKEHKDNLSGVLSVYGLKLGTIKRHSDVMRGGIVPGDWLKKLDWDRKSKENRVPDILWRTLVADRSPDGGKPPGWYQRACLHCLKDTRISDNKGNLHSSKVHETSEMTSMFLKRVRSVIWNRRIFEMEPNKGFMDPLFGLAPEGTEAGDIVCILFGCTVPVVLKRLEKDSTMQELYELVGEAYVHGVMDGEAVQDEELVKDLTCSFLLK